MTACGESPSGAQHAAGRIAGVGATIDDRTTADDDVLHAGREPVRIVERRAVRDGGGVECNQIRPRTRSDDAEVLAPQSGSGQRRHLADRLLEREHPQLAHVAAEHPGVGAVAAWVRCATRAGIQRPSIAGDRHVRMTHHRADVVLVHAEDDHLHPVPLLREQAQHRVDGILARICGHVDEHPPAGVGVSPGGNGADHSRVAVAVAGPGAGTAPEGLVNQARGTVTALGATGGRTVAAVVADIVRYLKERPDQTAEATPGGTTSGQHARDGMVADGAEPSRYYADEGQRSGRWLGQGARTLGLHGDVDAQDLHAGRTQDLHQDLAGQAEPDKLAGGDLINEAGAQIFGRAVKEIVGKHDTELFTAEGAAVATEVMLEWLTPLAPVPDVPGTYHVNTVEVTGLTAAVRVLHADADLDTLVLDTLGGADVVSIDADVQDVIQVTVQ